MNEIKAIQRTPVYTKEGGLNLSPSIPSINGDSVDGIITRTFRYPFDSRSFLRLSFSVKPFQLFLNRHDLEGIGLTDQVIDRIKNSRSKDRFEDLKETLLVRPYADLEINPWKPIAEQLSSKVEALTQNGIAINKSKDFFNRIVQLRKSFIFTVIKVTDAFEFVIGRRGENGDIFVVSKNAGLDEIWNKNGTSIKRACVEEISDVGESSRDVVLKENSPNLKIQSFFEKKGHKSVKGLSPHIIEYLGDLIDVQKSSWEPIGLVLPSFSGNVLQYLKAIPSRGTLFFLKECRLIFLEVFKQIAEAVKTMHQNDLVHSDIKIDNIFLSWNSNLEITETVLADFSNTDSKEKEMTYTSKFIFLNEALEAKNKENCKSGKSLEVRKRIDIRQLGFFFYYMLSAVRVGNKGALLSPYPLIEERELRWPDFSKPYIDLPEDVSLTLRNLIKSMLSPNVSEVPSIEQVSEILDSLKVDE